MTDECQDNFATALREFWDAISETKTYELLIKLLERLEKKLNTLTKH